VFDAVLEFQDFAFDIHGDFAGKVSFGHGGGDTGDVAHLRGEVAGHGVDAVGQVLPGAANAFDLGLAAELAFGADFAGHSGDFGGKRVQLVHHGIDGVFQLEDFAFDIHGDFAVEVAFGDRGGHVGDVAHLRGEIPGH